MMQTKKVVLYGSSLFIVGLEASLVAVPGLDIQRVEAQRDDSLDRLRAAAPEVIIVEQGGAPADQAFTLLKEFPGVVLIGLDLESDQLLVLSVHQQASQAVADLVQVIHKQVV
jgi:hypothetical protein